MDMGGAIHWNVGVFLITTPPSIHQQLIISQGNRECYDPLPYLSLNGDRRNSVFC